MPAVDSVPANEAAIVVPAKTPRSKLLRVHVVGDESLLSSTAESTIIFRVLFGLCIVVLTEKLVAVSSSTSEAITRIIRREGRVKTPRRFILDIELHVTIVIGADED